MTGYEETTGTFVSAQDNVTMFFRVSLAPDEHARLIVSHGVGEHSGRYENVRDQALPRGISVWALDHRGHGRSGGTRGHVRSFDEYAADLHTFVERVRTSSGSSVKTFLLGHSMGGAIALQYAAANPRGIDGLIVSAPAVGLNFVVPTWKRMMGSALSALPFPLPMDNGLDPRNLSRDEAVVFAYSHDPLVHRKITVQWFRAFLAAMERAREAAPLISVPVLMQAGSDDRIVAPDSVREIFSRLTIKDKTFIAYPGCRHEIYNEPEPDRSTVLNDLFSWIERHC